MLDIFTVLEVCIVLEHILGWYLFLETAEGVDGKKRQKRGGKGQVKTKKKEAAPAGLTISHFHCYY